MQVHCGTWVVIQNYVAKDLFLKDNDNEICLGLVEEIQLHKLMRMAMLFCYLLTLKKMIMIIVICSPVSPALIVRVVGH